MNYNISYPFYLSSRRQPSDAAVVFGHHRLSYGALRISVQRLASSLSNRLTRRRVGILASRSIHACVGVLATAWAGGHYVAINLRTPPEELQRLLEFLQLDALIVDAAGVKLLTPDVLTAAPYAVYAPGAGPAAFLSYRNNRPIPDTVVLREPQQCGPGDLACMHLSTAPNAGPEGGYRAAMVPNGALFAYLDAIDGWYDLSPNDRAAETADLTSMLSVHNMLTTWKAGAALHIMQLLEMLAPGTFVQRHGITTWLSAPSVITGGPLGGPPPGGMPTLRLSLFCGAALSSKAAEIWRRATPNSLIETLHGPPEAPVACFRRSHEDGAAAAPGLSAALGQVFPGMQAEIFDDDLSPLPDGWSGQIALTGRQLATAYFQEPALTAQCFPIIGSQRWYLSGHRGYRDADGTVHHLGPMDMPDVDALRRLSENASARGEAAADTAAMSG
ncbi:AMP-binding protein [Pseudohoeflea coraliihabitans]|uniref:AMP-binding protein n=1 Tax=Pseudohoeflea coraliihabitans TaxID=2860393 RepID=A0ABS6WS62_9HYPH|nr:AMP-binding protein [Pseudohoeflea sp. DP4N28-3]MBW3098630.1 AMP-binding protein [Pseudohoeflea sp. DP4N28-3]